MDSEGESSSSSAAKQTIGHSQPTTTTTTSNTCTNSQLSTPSKAQSGSSTEVAALAPLNSMRTGLEEGDKGISLSKLPRKRGGLAKRDRSTLRKGKWTLEEEEYTSRIIHYFSTGLLTLPEGSTLRSYLAEKLNCDPMRITKKYAGAACLGKRAYQYRERSQPTIAEIQLAKAQLDELEHRFRMRVEEGYSGAPLPSPSELILSSLSQQQSQLLMQNQSNSAAALQSLLLGLSGAAAGGAVLAGQSVGQPMATVPPWNLAPSPQVPQVIQAPWILPNVSAPPVAVAAPAPVQPQAIDFGNLSRLALAGNQIPPHLAPVLSQLAAAHTLQKPSPAPPQQPTTTSNAMNGQQQQHQQQRHQQQDQIAAYASELKKAYELHAAAAVQAKLVTAPPFAAAAAVRQPPVQTAPPTIGALSARVQSSNSAPPAGETTNLTKPRTEEDKAAGSILLGFLSSLRHSYLEAVREKQNEDSSSGTDEYPPPLTTDSNGRVNHLGAMVQAPTVTDSASSQRAESSVEDSDWISEKKNDPSSSEDSDKETPMEHSNKKRGRVSNTVSGDEVTIRLSKGPPRKRLKMKKLSKKMAIDSP